jgi:hypothetical protein
MARRGRPYRAGVISSARPAALRWVLLFVLAFAVIGMHSLIAEDPTHASGQPVMAMAGGPRAVMSTEHRFSAGPLCCPDDRALAAEHRGHSSGHGHDMQHLCLAVLIAAFALMMGLLLWGRDPTVFATGEPSPSVTRAGRGPPRARRTADLLSLCVLRL